jgi:hypothetical protein
MSVFTSAISDVINNTLRLFIDVKDNIDDNALDIYNDLIEEEDLDLDKELDKDLDFEDKFVTEIGVGIGIINTIHVVYVLLGVCYSYLFWEFITKVSYNCVWAINYMFDVLWDSLDKGQEWIQIACIVSTIWATWCIFQFARESNDRIDNYIDKLKSEHADLLKEKDAIIAGLEKELGRGTDYDSDAEYDLDTDTESEINYDFDSDSDYDPDEDEY